MPASLNKKKAVAVLTLCLCQVKCKNGWDNPIEVKKVDHRNIKIF